MIGRARNYGLNRSNLRHKTIVHKTTGTVGKSGGGGIRQATLRIPLLSRRSFHQPQSNHCVLMKILAVQTRE